MSNQTYRLISGNASDELSKLESDSVHCAITSPPYYKLRTYKDANRLWNANSDCEHIFINNTCETCGGWFGELGQEPSPHLYIARLVEIFNGLKRVLRNDGVFWLNIADTYSGIIPAKYNQYNLKPKELCGIPHRLVTALQASGWRWRSDCVWSKVGTNCKNCNYRMEKGSSLPEACNDRFSRAHEYVFLLTKSDKYYFDTEGAKDGKARRRDVITMPSSNFRGQHFATMPESLAEILIKATTSDGGCCSECGKQFKRLIDKSEPDLDWQLSAGGNRNGGYTGSNTKSYEIGGAQKASDVKRRILASMKKIETIGWAPDCKCNNATTIPATVIDPFSGAATTGVVAMKYHRNYIGIDISSEYNDSIAEPRLAAALLDQTPIKKQPTLDYLPLVSNIYHGDAHMLLPRVPENSVRLILTDPPYNVSRDNNLTTMNRRGIDFEWDYDFDQSKWIYLADAALMPGGSIVIWNSWENLGLIKATLENLGYDVKRNLIWIKSNPFPRNINRSFVQTTEQAIWAVKPGGKWVFNKTPCKTMETGIFTYPVPKQIKARPRHDTKKPDAMFKSIIEILSNKDDLILDPFSGGGTTCAAACATGRKHISFELDDRWYKESVEHWLDVDPNNETAARLKRGFNE